MWRHVKQCPFNDEIKIEKGEEPKVHRKLQYESELLLLSNKYHEGCSEALASQVLSTMRQDHITNVVKADKLILMVGTSLLERGGSSKVPYVSQRMRTLSRLLISIQDLECSIQSLADCIEPSKFDSIVQATKILSGYSPGNRDKNSAFSKPSLALNIGYDLHKAAILLRGQAIRLNHKDQLDKITGFIQLYELEWKTFVSSIASRSLDENKFKSPTAVPITSDLLKLREFCLAEMPACISRLKVSPSLSDWRFLAELTATRVIVFNKRRGNEGTKIKIDDFLNRPDWTSIQNEDIVNSLQPLEKELCSR